MEVRVAGRSLSACIAEIKANPGKFYVYVLSRPAGEPFYVGLGQKARIAYHQRDAIKRQTIGHKASTIRKIVSSGDEVGYEIVGWFDTWADGAVIERALIAQYGRTDMGTGILANGTDGGDGIPNLKWMLTPARAAGVKRAADKNKGRKHTEDHRANIGAALKGRSLSEKNKANLSKSLKGRKFDEGWVAAMREAALRRSPETRNLDAVRRWHDENRDKVAETQRKNWEDPEYREKMMPLIKAAKRDFSYRRDPAYRENIRAKARERWADPEFKARAAASIRAAKAKSKSSE
jgi:hypothetical protein